MTCECGHELPGVALYCRNCLALHIDVDGRTPLQGNEHLLVLLDACEQVAAGNATLEDFHLFVDDFTEELAKREQEIHKIEIPPYLETDFAEEREAGLKGVERCNNALDILRSLRFGQHDSSRVKAALQEFYEGFCLVSEAMVINRRNRDRPLWG